MTMSDGSRLASLHVGWALAAAVCVAAIWGNSLVPGTQSSGLSMLVVQHIRAMLSALGMSSGWVTNLLVRKIGHVSEYALFGFAHARAWGVCGHDRGCRTSVGLMACAVAIPVVDETIQLFVPGRMGLATDVLIDCAGIALGFAAHDLAVRHRARARR